MDNDKFFSKTHEALEATTFFLTIVTFLTILVSSFGLYQYLSEHNASSLFVRAISDTSLIFSVGIATYTGLILMFVMLVFPIVRKGMFTASAGLVPVNRNLLLNWSKFGFYVIFLVPLIFLPPSAELFAVFGCVAVFYIMSWIKRTGRYRALYLFGISYLMGVMTINMENTLYWKFFILFLTPIVITSIHDHLEGYPWEASVVQSILYGLPIFAAMLVSLFLMKQLPQPYDSTIYGLLVIAGVVIFVALINFLADHIFELIIKAPSTSATPTTSAMPYTVMQKSMVAFFFLMIVLFIVSVNFISFGIKLVAAGGYSVLNHNRCSKEDVIIRLNDKDNYSDYFYDKDNKRLASQTASIHIMKASDIDELVKKCKNPKQ